MVMIHSTSSSSGRNGVSWFSMGDSPFSSGRYRQPECCTRARRAGDGDFPPHFVHQLPADVQPQARAFVPRFGTEERLENSLKILVRNARPRIDNFDVKNSVL